MTGVSLCGETPGYSLAGDVFVSLRPDQWTKNFFIFAALMFGDWNGCYCIRRWSSGHPSRRTSITTICGTRPWAGAGSWNLPEPSGVGSGPPIETRCTQASVRLRRTEPRRSQRPSGGGQAQAFSSPFYKDLRSSPLCNHNRDFSLVRDCR